MRPITTVHAGGPLLSPVQALATLTSSWTAKPPRDSLLVRALALGLAFAVIHQQAEGANRYFDANGVTAGGGDPCNANVSGGSNWSTSDAGTNPSVWTANDTAIFSAGAPGNTTATCNSGITAAGIIVEDGTVVIAAPSAITVGTGVVTVNSGKVLSVDSAARIAATGGSITLNGGTFRNTTAVTTGAFIDADEDLILGTGGGILDVSNAAGQSLLEGAKGVSGSSLTKVGAGILAIARACTYTGSTTVNDGILRVRTSNDRFPTATDLTVTSPGVFSLNGLSQQIGSLTGNGSVTLGSNGLLTIGGSTSPAVFSGAITATSLGRLTKQGTGTLTLGGANSFTGTFTLTAGTVTVNSGGALCGALCDVAVNGGALNLNNTAQTIENLNGSGGTINLGTGHTLTQTAAANSSYSGAIAGSGAFTKTDANNQTLSGSSTYDGITTLTGTGTITVGSATGLGSANGKTVVPSGAGINFSGASFTISEPFDIAGTGNAVATGGAIFVQASSTVTFSGTITLTADAAFGVAGTSNATLSNATAFSAANKNLTLQGGSGAGVKTVSGAISLGTGSLTKAQGGTWILSAANSYSGGTTISASGGTLDVRSDGALGSGNVSVASGTTLKLGSGTTNSYIDSSASLLLNGATPTVNLAFTGTPNTINALSFDGGSTFKASGTWGGTGSGAQHINSRFTGTGTINVTTGGTNTSTVVSSISPNPSCFGTTVNLTATVTPNTATGLVEFFDNAVSLGTATLSGGLATLPAVAGLAVGSHPITAKYLGDDDHNLSPVSGSVSAVVDAIQPPTAICQNISAPLGAGSATVNASAVNNGSTPGGNCSQVLTAYEIAKGDHTGDCATATFGPSVSFNCGDAGPQTVTLRVTQTDGQQSCCVATVTVTNDPPVITQGAGPLSLTVATGSTCPGAANEVALSATDGNGDTLTWTISGLPGSGSASITGSPGSSVTVCYQPSGGPGSDSFTVEVADGCGGTDTITVNVTIANAPTVTSAKSVRVHGGSTELAIELIGGGMSEPRRNGIQKLLFTFSETMVCATHGGTPIASDIGASAVPSFAVPAPVSIGFVGGGSSGTQLVVTYNQGDLPDLHEYTFDLTGKFKSQSGGLVLGGTPSVNVHGMEGDVTFNGMVTNVGDVSQTKNHNGDKLANSSLNDSNCQYDANTDGSTNLVDVAFVKSKLTP